MRGGIVKLERSARGKKLAPLAMELDGGATIKELRVLVLGSRRDPLSVGVFQGEFSGRQTSSSQ